jgi:hypothetical protein
MAKVESKSERMAKVVEKSAKVTPLPTNTISKALFNEGVEKAVAKVEDQKAVKAEDQKTPGTGETKKKRKFSETHVAWVAQEELPLTGKITVLAKGNPKRANSKSAARFDLYEPNMSVQQYIDKCDKSAISNKKLAMMDVRWDVTKKFIEVK